MSFIPMSLQANFNFYKDLSLKEIDEEEFGQQLTKEIFNNETWPKNFEYNDKNYEVHYQLNEKLITKIKRELRRYGSDFASVVVIDNETGGVLAAVDYTKKNRKFGKSLSFASTNPAASVFKVITAAELLENTDISPETYFSYNGKATTLYKYQLRDRKNRWTRKIPLEKAFAYSNNVVFGKAALKNTDLSSLSKMANKFGFNQSLLQLIDVGDSELMNEQDRYALAELASGFNRKTNISPLHGAVIASVIANNGLLKRPALIKEVRDKNHNRTVWEPKFSVERVLSTETAAGMQHMMELTVKRGTARGAFRSRYMRKLRHLDIGGKTGTITGGFPYGKRDWFISYAKPKDGSNKGISICVMIVNVKKWYIKSTVLTKKIMEHYYDIQNG